MIKNIFFNIKNIHIIIIIYFYYLINMIFLKNIYITYNIIYIIISSLSINIFISFIYIIGMQQKQNFFFLSILSFITYPLSLFIIIFFFSST